MIGALMLTAWMATPTDAGALIQRLDALQHTARALYVAAHPDDENTALLAWLAQGRKVRAGYLSLTRGSGGQNIVGPEVGPLLGVMRTHELLQARGVDGAHQMFSRAVDFGYSKAAEEALGNWGHEAVLDDVVRAVRTFRPHVIITRFPEEGPTHGHHLASARLAREAFAAAADPARFPEQGLPPWQATRVVYNVGRFMEPDTKAKPGELAVDIGGYAPLLGKSYGELAADSRTMHKSQGFGASPRRGPNVEIFRPVAGAPAKTDLFDGVPMGWDQIPGGPAVSKALKAARAALRPDDPAAALPALAKALAAAKALKDAPLRDATVESIEALMLGCAGLHLDAVAPAPYATPGESVKIEVQALLRNATDLARLDAVEIVAQGGAPQRGGQRAPKHALRRHAPWSKTLEIALPDDAAVTVPHWLRAPKAGALYDIEAGPLVNAPLDAPALRADFTLTLAGTQIRASVPVIHTRTDRVHGELRRAVAVVPPVTLSPDQAVLVHPAGAARDLTVTVRAFADAEATVRPVVPKGWQVTPPEATVNLKAEGRARVRFTFTPGEGAALGPARLEAQVKGRPGRWRWSAADLEYTHIPEQTVLQAAEVVLAPVNVQAPAGPVGYIPGSGDDIPEALRRMGVQVQIVDDEALAAGDLTDLPVIITGIRAYNVNKALRTHHQRLVDEYVAKGGRLVVQYQTHTSWRPLGLDFAPKAMALSRGRVTDERAAITLLQPKHPLLTTPNTIAPEDFEGWVQERGLYFAESWDPAYVPLMRMADPGEEAQSGAFLYLRHGDGEFIYTGLSLFRQLPAGVPGAYRLLANLLTPTQAHD